MKYRPNLFIASRSKTPAQFRRILLTAATAGLAVASACANGEGGKNENAESCAPLPAGAPQTSPNSTASPELIAGGTALFNSLLTKPNNNATCSNDYSKIDFCFNAENPPAPSIARTIGFTRDGFADGISVAKPTAERNEVNAGDYQLRPHGRTTNDGRIGLRIPFENWAEFYVIRPENLGYDSTAQTESIQSRVAGEVHGLAVFNPFATNFSTTGSDPDVWMAKGSGAVSILHSTICEDSTPQVAGSARNPVACRARYGTFSYYSGASEADSDTYEEGLCYQITLLMGAARDNSRSGAGIGAWELRSTPLTVFVRNPYQKTTGEQRMWVYPQNPQNALDTVDSQGVATLPDFADYDIGRVMPWCQMQKSTDLRAMLSNPQLTMNMSCDGQNERVINAQCYVQQNGTWQRNADAPRWCEFLFDQSFQSKIHFDNNLDAVVNRTDSSSEAWNGRGKYTLFELATSGDGDMVMVNNNQGVFYSINDNSKACEAAGFRHFMPTSLLPKDERARTRYAVARTRNHTPFRDPRGNDIPFGSIQRAAYQWIDRAGTNMMFSLMNEQRDAYKATDINRIPMQPGNDGASYVIDPNTERERFAASMNSRAGHQVVVVGAWTNHKYVVPDNQVNASDFGGGATFARSATKPDGSSADNHYIQQYNLPLYRDRTLRFAPVGASSINSFENVFGMFDAARPLLPQDVVWNVHSNNQRDSELAFDDYVSDKPLIVAHMNAAIAIDNNRRSADGRVSSLRIGDGFTPRDFFATNADYSFNTSPRTGDRVLLQNAATLSPVKELRVRGGARVEPVALGGVAGRGLFLDGRNDFVDAGYPTSAKLRNYYMSMWAEPQQIDSVERTLFYFADHSLVALKGKPAPATDCCVTGYTQGQHLSCAAKSDFSPALAPLPCPSGQYAVSAQFECQEIGLPASACIPASFGDIDYFCAPAHWNNEEYSCPAGTTATSEQQCVSLGECRSPALIPTLVVRPSTNAAPIEIPLTGAVVAKSFAHLGIMVSDQGETRSIEVFVNGDSVGHAQIPRASLDLGFDIGHGWSWFAVGSPYPAVCGTAGCSRSNFAGWIDELRVIPVDEDDRSDTSYFRESICNHALGTLVDANASLTAELAAKRELLRSLGRTPNAICEQMILGSHNDPADFARQTGRGKMCIDKVHRNGGDAAACLRSARLGMTTLQPDEQRPVQATNAFCLSCHNDAQPIDGLKISALTERNELRWEDHRRQPMNPPATLALPTNRCDASSPLAGTFYVALPKRSVLVETTRWTTDHVFDLGVKGTDVKPFFPPLR